MEKERIIADILGEIGFTANHKGYFYTKEAVAAVCDEPMIPTTKVLYPEIAKKYNTTPTRVERCIRSAIECAFERADPNTLNHYFGGSINPKTGKLTNSEFLSVLAEYIRLGKPVKTAA